MSIQRWGFGIVAFFVMMAPVTFPSPATAGDLLLEILLEKGIITKDELIRLKAEEEKREAAKAAEQAKKKPEVKVDVVKEKQQTVKAAVQTKKKSGVKVGFGKKGFTLATADGLFKTKIQWRFQGRWTYPERSDPRKRKNFMGNKDPAESTFELRRVRMKVGGHGYKPWIKYYLEVDWQPGRDFDDGAGNAATRLIDWRIMLEKYPWAKLRIGQWKINYSRERVDSSGKQTMVERSIMNRVFTIDRQIGVMLYGRVNPGTPVDMNYYLGIYSGSGRGVAKNDDDNMMYMARLQWNMFGRELKWRQSDVKFHKKPTGSLSLAGYTTTGKCTRWSSGGCGNLDSDGAKFISPGDAKVGQFRVEGVQVGSAFKYRGFAWQHETHWKQVKDLLHAHKDLLHAHSVEKDATNDQQTNMFGGYAMAGYFPHYIFPAIPKPLEVAFRYSHVDPNISKSGDFRQEYTGGMNWFFAGHRNKLTLDVSHLTLTIEQPDGSGRDDLTEQRIRIQWDVSF